MNILCAAGTVEALGTLGEQDRQNPCSHEDDLLSQEPDRKQLINIVHLTTILASVVCFFCVPRSQCLSSS